MAESDVFCYGELHRFPATQFFTDDDGALVHKVKPQHFAATGALLESAGLPVLFKKVNPDQPTGRNQRDR